MTERMKLPPPSHKLDRCDKCDQPSASLAYVERDGFDFLGPGCRFTKAEA